MTRGRLGAVVAHGRTSLPSLGVSLAGSSVWATFAGAGAFLNIRHWETASHQAEVTTLFVLGGFTAFAPALFAARFLSGRRADATGRFAAMFLSLALATTGITALLFGLEYRTYYAEWHAETFSYVWGLQLFFTMANALYQFAVIGMRFYFPIGFAAIFVFSLWFARAARPDC